MTYNRAEQTYIDFLEQAQEKAKRGEELTPEEHAVVYDVGFDENPELGTELSKIKGEQQELKKTINQMASDIRTNAKGYNSIAGDLGDLKTQIKQLTGRLHNYIQEHPESNKFREELNTLKEEQSHFNEKFEQIISDIHKNNDNYSSLKEEQSTFNVKLDKIAGDTRSSIEKHDIVTKTLASMNGKIDKISHQRAIEKLEHTERQYIQKLKNENGVLKEKSKALEGNYKLLENTNKFLVDTNNSLINTNNSLKDKIEEIVKSRVEEIVKSRVEEMAKARIEELDRAKKGDSQSDLGSGELEEEAGTNTTSENSTDYVHPTVKSILEKYKDPILDEIYTLYGRKCFNTGANWAFKANGGSYHHTIGLTPHTNEDMSNSAAKLLRIIRELGESNAKHQKNEKNLGHKYSGIKAKIDEQNYNLNNLRNKEISHSNNKKILVKQIENEKKENNFLKAEKENHERKEIKLENEVKSLPDEIKGKYWELEILNNVKENPEKSMELMTHVKNDPLITRGMERINSSKELLQTKIGELETRLPKARDELNCVREQLERTSGKLKGSDYKLSELKIKHGIATRSLEEVEKQKVEILAELESLEEKRQIYEQQYQEESSIVIHVNEWESELNCTYNNLLHDMSQGSPYDPFTHDFSHDNQPISHYE